MKSFFALFLVLVMAFALCACQGMPDFGKKDEEEKKDEESVAGKYILVSVSVEDEELSTDDMADAYGDDCYIQMEDDGTAVLKKDGKKHDLEWEEDEIWYADEDDQVGELKIKGDKVTVVMEIDDEEVTMVFEKESSEDDEEDDKEDPDEDKDDKDNKDDKEDEDDGDNKTQKPDVKNPDYIGKWEYEYKIAKTIAETFEKTYGDTFQAPTTSMEIFMEITFDADGTYSLEYILNEDAINNYCLELADAMEDCMYSMYTKQGMSRQDVDALIEKLYGATMEEYCLQVAETAVSYESLYNRLVTNNAYGYHKLEDGKIYVTPQENDWDNIYGYYVYSVSGDELVIEDMYNAETDKLYSEDTLSQSFGSLQLPWVMTRK